MSVESKYVVITPVRNEELYIEETIKSMIAQTLKPTEWIIVDDGSTDRTPEIIDKYTKKFYWIKRIAKKDDGIRKTGGKVIEVFCEGYKNIVTNGWEFVVKLDSDLSFDETYFERLIGRFLEDDRLGIASGVYLELDSNGVWRQVKMPFYHAAGACKVLRRECYEEIEGFVPVAGWDTVDEIRAMVCGWKTRHFDDLKMKHHKPEGSGIGMLRTSVMHGEIYYRTGGDRLFFVFKLLYRMMSRPYFLGTLALLWGYLKAILERKTLLVSDREARCYKAMLRERLRMGIKRAVRERIS